MTEREQIERDFAIAWCGSKSKDYNFTPDMLLAFAKEYEQLKQGSKLPIDSVSHCSKGRLAEEFQKGYKEGYEDGANAAANDIAANPHKMY